MYLRFVSPVPADRARGHYGLFRPAYGVARARETPDGLRCAIRAELDWFEDKLPVPPRWRFDVKSKKRYYAEGICWFRADTGYRAREMLAHAYVLVSLLREEGVFITRLETEVPGQILYRDDWQIVAKPSAVTPVRWG